MNKKILMIACAILAAITVGSLSLRLMPAGFAHSQNTAVWQGAVFPPEEKTVKSDLLSQSGQTVILNNTLSEEKTVVVSIISSGASVKGSFSCSMTEEAGKYLTATFDETQITVGDGETKTATLTLKATEEGKSLTSVITETVHVEWKSEQNEILSADILVPLGTAPETDPAAEAEPEKTEVETLITNHTPTFSDEVPVGIQLSPEEGCEKVLLNWNGGDFPSLVKYTVNNKSYVLYDGGVISIPSADITENTATVFLDFSNTTAEKGDYYLSAVEYVGEKIQTQIVNVTKAEKGISAEPAGTKVLTETNSLNLYFGEWENCVGTLALYRLETDEAGNAAWVKLEENSGIDVSLSEDYSLQISIKEPSPPAGTYQLETVWKFCGVSMAEIKSVFFVQYDGLTASES